MNSRRIRHTLVALGVVLAGTMVAAPSASAATTETAYLFVNKDYQGQRFVLSNSDISQFGPGLNDAISSLQVSKGTTWCFYVDPNFSGDYVRAPGPYTLSYVGNYNDRFSSARRC
ncbi:peptidase inhibitor family I36 protein [Micromonospora sp. NPDC049102]|uniref:peptidase inhibitor family I36 protein n=1 Tax=Micromonospora sp. NPDC049102 TaxID=3364265 RepID=UPI00371FED76